MRTLLATLFVLGLSACASQPAYESSVDQVTVSTINHHAQRNGYQIYWINYPEKYKKVDASKPAS